MTDETVSVSTTIGVAAATVFAVLADPRHHASIDGTGWVCDALDGQPITTPDQIFRMGMFHPDHPDGSYEIHNRVLTFDPPRAISWMPGYLSPETGALDFGGWVWRYDLVALASDRTQVTLAYDWSGVGPGPREYLQFPPFAPDHLDNSLAHLAEIAASDETSSGLSRPGVAPRCSRPTD